MLIFGLLLSLCVEYDEAAHPGPSPDRRRYLTRVFFAKLGAAISELRLLMTLNLEYVTALIIAVCYTQNLSHSGTY